MKLVWKWSVLFRITSLFFQQSHHFILHIFHPFDPLAHSINKEISSFPLIQLCTANSTLTPDHPHNDASEVGKKQESLMVPVRVLWRMCNTWNFRFCMICLLQNYPVMPKNSSLCRCVVWVQGFLITYRIVIPFRRNCSDSLKLIECSHDYYMLLLSSIHSNLTLNMFE